MNLNNFFNPKSIALIGATDRKKSVGLAISKNLLLGENRRKVFFVNPNKEKVLGKKVYSNILDIKEKVDLAIIAVPSEIVLEVVKNCAQKKVGAVLVISSGFAETGRSGEENQEKIVKILREYNIPLMGPNCLGILSPYLKLNASFAPGLPREGGISFLSQSGALIDSVIDNSLTEGYGFSNLISYGNEADVDVSDFLEFLKKDDKTKVIAIYLEGLKDGRKLIKISQDTRKKKPIVILKGGKTFSGNRAVFSHTGSLAGTPQIYSTAFKKAGILEVETLKDLLDVSLSLDWQPACKGKVGVVTNGGAYGVMVADWCEKFGVRASEPVDILGDALSEDYKKAIKNVLRKKEIGGVIIVQTFQAMTEAKENTKIILEASKKWPQKPIISCVMTGKHSSVGIEILRKNKIPNYSEPRQAVLAMKALLFG